VNGISEYDFRQVFGQMIELRMVNIDITGDRISVTEKLFLLQYFGKANTVNVDHSKIGKCIPIEMLRSMRLVV
jgi:hypothetical protein